MTERTQKPENPKPAPFEIFKAAANLGRRGDVKLCLYPQRNEFVGDFEGRRISIRSYFSSGNEVVEILGDGINTVIQNLDDDDTSPAQREQYRVIGDVPENILEILSSLQPINKR